MPFLAMSFQIQRAIVNFSKTLNLVLAIKKMFCVYMITFTSGRRETTLKAQNKPESIDREIEKPTELLAYNSQPMLQDTSELFFFSFDESRAVPYHKKIVNTEDSKTSTVYVCENNSIVLSTPDFGEDAIYSWKGPAGFSSISQQIRLEKITSFQAGFYNFTIKKNGSTTIGKIKLMVKERPRASCYWWPVLLWRPNKIECSRCWYWRELSLDTPSH